MNRRENQNNQYDKYFTTDILINFKKILQCIPMTFIQITTGDSNDVDDEAECV